MTENQLCILSGMTRSAIRYARQRKELRDIPNGRRYYIDDVMKFLDRRKGKVKRGRPVVNIPTK